MSKTWVIKIFDNLKIFLMYNKYVDTLHYLFISVYHGWMNFYKRITILFIYGDVYALFICSEVLIILYPRVNRAYGIHFVLKNSFFALIFCNDGHHKVFITKTFVQIWILDQSTNQCIPKVLIILKTWKAPAEEG